MTSPLLAAFNFNCFIDSTFASRSRWRLSAKNRQKAARGGFSLPWKGFALPSPFWPFSWGKNSFWFALCKLRGKTDRRSIDCVRCKVSRCSLCSAILGCAIYSLTHRVFVVAVVHRRFLAAIGINILIELEKKILENGLSEENYKSGTCLHINMDNSCWSSLRTSSALDDGLRCLTTSAVVLLLVFCNFFWKNMFKRIWPTNSSQSLVFSFSLRFLTFIVVRSIRRWWVLVGGNIFWWVLSSRGGWYVGGLEWILDGAIGWGRWRLGVTRPRRLWIFGFELKQVSRQSMKQLSSSGNVFFAVLSCKYFQQKVNSVNQIYLKVFS